MSSKLRTKVDFKIIEEEHVSAEKKKQCLNTSIYSVSDINPFLCAILQCMDIFYTHQMPRAGILFDSDTKKWQMGINPKWFCDKLTDKNRVAVLLHEIYHITHKHPMRAPFLKLNPQRRYMMNIAMDLAINQLIKNLPDGCQSCPPIEEQFKGAQCKAENCPGSAVQLRFYFEHDEKGNKVLWEENMPMEHYYQRMIQRYEDMKEGGEEGEEGEDGQGNGPGNGKPSGMNNSQEEFDGHHWEGNAEESEMMGATEDIVKRAMQKTGLTYDRLDASIKELLQDIEARRAELNYRAIILSAIKKHASGFNREHSWTRRSRRFGNKAPGTRNGNLPYLANYIDTSGSISVQEANDHLGITDEFLRVGSRKCDVGLWHTNLYYFEEYKLGNRFEKSNFESGGTDLHSTLKQIYETQPDLAIIYTDGCYGDVDFEEWMKPGEHFPQVLWIISRDGTEHHPLTRLGETIKIPATAKILSDRNLEN